MGVLFVLVLLTFLSFLDIQAGRETLSFLSHSPSLFYRENVEVLTIVFFIIAGIISFRFVGVVLLLFSQLAFVFSWVNTGIILLVFGIVITLWKHTFKEDSELKGTNLFLILIVTLGAIFRLYALNFIPNEFEGELACYSAGATGNWFAANKGLAGPWAPLGLLYYPPIWVASEIFGSTLYAIRVSSAWVGILTFIPLFLFVREAFGVRVALLSCLIFVFDPLHIGWSRTDVHPHGVTAWPAFFLGYFFLKAWKTDSFMFWAFVALTMGLTWHQYPSGQSFVVAPILVLTILRLTSKRISWRAELAIFSGIALWLLGLPASYYFADGILEFKNPFTLTTSRASWGEEASSMYVIEKAASHMVDVVQGIFIKVPYLFHQDFLPEYLPLPQTTVPALLVPFFVFGFILILKRGKKVESIILISLILASLAPGILSSHAYPKRFSVFFPLIDILAAVGLVTVFSNLPRKLVSVVIFIGVIFWSEVTWSSWFVNKWGKSFEEYAAEEIKKRLEPGTILAVRAWESYLEAKLLYLLLDKLEETENLGYLRIRKEDPFPYDYKELLLREYNLWPYLWTNIPKYKEGSWSKVVFIKQRGEPWDDKILSTLQSKCENSIFMEKLVILDCKIKSN